MRKILLAPLYFCAAAAMADTKIEFLNGPSQAYLIYSEDPFAGTKSYKYMVVPSDLYVRCDSIELKGRDGYFNEFSFPAELRVKINETTYDFKGTYTTVGVSDSRYYRVTKSSSPKKFSELIKALEAGESALVGGKWRTDWEHSKVNLAGFSEAYKKLNCK